MSQPPPPPPSPNHHLRLGSNPLTPIIFDDDDSDDADHDDLQNPPSRVVRFSLHHVLGPAGREDPTETRILRSAEQQQQQQQTTSRRYSSPEEQQQDAALLQKMAADAVVLQEETHPLLRDSPNTTTTTTNTNNNNEHEEHDNDSDVQLKTQSRGKVHMGVLMGGHGRNPTTIEQQLFGLTTQLAQHHMDDSDNHTNNNNKKRSSSSSSRWEDAMAQTAHVVVGNAHAQTEQQMNTKRRFFARTSDVEAGGGGMEDDRSSPQGSSDNNKKKKSKTTKKTFKPTSKHGGAGELQDDLEDTLETNYSVFREFVSSKRSSMRTYVRRLFLYIVLPSMALAILFFYALGNPLAPPLAVPEQSAASWSWWFLLVGVRHPLVLTVAVAWQAFLIQFVVLRTQWLSRWFGPLVTLYLVQAKGWPVLAMGWATLSLLLLVGPEPYHQHWLYWQTYIGLFNAHNTAGTVTASPPYFTLVVTILTVAFWVTLKRLAVSLFLGRTTFAHFGEQLADNMKNMLLIGDLAALAKRMERKYGSQDDGGGGGARSSKYGGKHRARTASADDSARLLLGGNNKTVKELVLEEATALEQTQLQSNQPSAATAANAYLKGKNTTTAAAAQEQQQPGDTDRMDASVPKEFSESAQIKLTQLLDAWEEPTVAEERQQSKMITLSAVLQFRQALTLMSNKYPFSPAFGLADTREACVESAQQVFDRLMLRTPDKDDLPFETLALSARINKHTVDEGRLRELISIFRPDRDGRLAMLDFVRSIDKIYKSIRLLTTNIHNAKHTDAAVQNILDVLFWSVMVAYVLTQMGMDPVQLLVSLSTIFITFSFMFGKSFSKYIEGILFILLQRPYGVGDRIHLSKPDADTNRDGSSGWIVEDITLYKTTLYWGATNEKATIANGAISDFRVINANRSPNATVYVDMTFAIDTASELIETFREAVEHFLKDRPREWLAFNGFRPTKVAIEQGFMNYMIIASHRNSWQDIGGILTSKAELVKFSLEIAKQLDMRYISPPLPVELSIQASDNGLVTPATIASMGGK